MRSFLLHYLTNIAHNCSYNTFQRSHVQMVAVTVSVIVTVGMLAITERINLTVMSSV